MADLVQSALRRKLAAAEAAGDFERVERLRERMGLPVEEAPEPAEPVGPVGLDAVEFASPAARRAAEAAGLSAETFEPYSKSAGGGFSKADVEKIVEIESAAPLEDEAE